MGLAKNIKSPEQLIFHYLNVILRRWKTIALVGTVIVAGALTYCLTAPHVFESYASIMPFQQSGNGGLAGLSDLADMAKGLGLGSFTKSGPHALYPAILKSRHIQSRILKREFYTHKYGDRRPLYEIYNIKSDSPLEVEHYGLKKLAGGTDIVTDRKTNVITIQTQAEEPQLAADIANAYVEELKEFNLKLRNSRAKENREFIEERLEETKQELVKAENRLKEFRESNLRIGNSPELLMEQGRLTREVKIQEQVFLTLTKEYEIAKIDEQKSIPAVNVLDEAAPPAEKSKPQRVKIMMLAMLGGLVMGIAFAMVLEYFEDIDDKDEEYRKLILRYNNARNRIFSIATRKKETSNEPQV
ncbi:MAG: hypothetical protein GF307_13840 [candidate division Zixibacteria bacterium]|nr:hypothetical protein [candidate division Zixibacteria bacterium]